MRISKNLVLLAALILAAGMSSAAILSSFGNVRGTTGVTGPNLYAADSNRLLIEGPPAESEKGVYQLDGPGITLFSTRTIDKEWYPVKVNMITNASLKTSSSSSTTIETGLYYTNKTGGQYHQVCVGQTSPVDSAEYETYSVSCSGQIDGPVKKFKFRIINLQSSDVNVSADGDTRVEVTEK